MFKPLYVRCIPIRDEEFRKLWSLEHTFCQACGIGHLAAESERWPGLSTHHIVKFRRSDEANNLLRLCQRCHDLAEGLQICENKIVLPKLTLGVTLQLKRIMDVDEWNSDRLCALFGRALPEPEPVPSFFEDEYREHRPWSPRKHVLCPSEFVYHGSVVGEVGRENEEDEE